MYELTTGCGKGFAGAGAGAAAAAAFWRAMLARVSKIDEVPEVWATGASLLAGWSPRRDCWISTGGLPGGVVDASILSVGLEIRSE